MDGDAEKFLYVHFIRRLSSFTPADDALLSFRFNYFPICDRTTDGCTVADDHTWMPTSAKFNDWTSKKYNSFSHHICDSIPMRKILSCLAWGFQATQMDCKALCLYIRNKNYNVNRYIAIFHEKRHHRINSWTGGAIIHIRIMQSAKAFSTVTKIH